MSHDFQNEHNCVCILLGVVSSRSSSAAACATTGLLLAHVFTGKKQQFQRQFSVLTGRREQYYRILESRILFLN